MKKRIFRVSIIAIFLIMILANSFKVYAEDGISVKAKAALIVEANTGKNIYEENAEDKNYPASVTKILTAIITIENCELDDIATVSKNAISHIPSGYVIAPLVIGEQIKIKDLLYALMLKSSNDAAYVLAEHVGGSVDGFSNMMNKKAKEIGCKGSNFVNPNGIHNKNHYTTAYDMYLIAKYAMENKSFAKIVSTYQYTLPATNKYLRNDRIMKNTNNFINPKNVYYNERVKGVKTGTTAQAGNCLITYSSENKLDFITVILGAQTSDSKFSETRKMINYAFDNYTTTELHKKGEVVKKIEVKKATKKTKNLDLVISDDIEVVNNLKEKVDNIKPEIELDEDIVAPIKKGQEIGTIEYNVDDVKYTAKLLAGSDVELKTYYIEIAVGVGIFFVGIIVFVIILKKKKQ